MVQAQVGASLVDHPWDYPLRPATESVLLGVPVEVDLTEGQREQAVWAPLQPKAHRRLGQACVQLGGQRTPPLNVVLLDRNVARVDERRPVAAFGSNADPAVLHRKFSDAGVSVVAPMRVGTMGNARLSVSAHVSRPGYLPAAAEHHEGGTLDVVVAWLDREQLQCLDETEPNYQRLVLDGDVHPVTLIDNGETLAGLAVYDTRWSTVPVDRPDAGQVTIWRDVLRLQPHVGALLGTGPDASDEEIRHVLLRLGEDEALRDATRALLKPFRVETALRGRRDGEALPYARLASRWSDAPCRGALTVRSTPDRLDRGGEVVVVVHPKMAGKLGLGDHAVLTPATVTGVAPCVLVAVHTDKRVGRREVQADQVARNAVGLELAEPAVLRPARVPPLGRAQRMLGRPSHVTCRIQAADLTTVERPVCLVDPLTLSLLGIKSGDRVVVQGLPGEYGVVRSVQLRAHEAPAPVLERRAELAGGGLESRFPSARDALAVHPDLPWVFLDSTTRDALGVPGKLGTVRLRASSWHQVTQELREFLLIALLTVIGLTTLIDKTWLLAVLIGVVLLACVALVVLRLRSRLTSPELEA